MRIVNFVDGAESETTPTIGNIVASNLVQYADDASYEAAEQGAPATGNVYYNTTDNTIRYYNGTTWQELVDENSVQALENKSIDADNNMITNIDNNEIKPLAGIEATKLADGSVTDTEFQYINSVTSNVQDQLDGKIPTAEKGAVNGVATLDGSGLVPAAQLPSYVDDVIEVANFAGLPGTGETGKIYVTLDDNKTYRWTGSVYVEVGPSSQANNNSLIEGGDWSVVENAGSAGQTIEQLVETGGLSLNETFLAAQTFTPSVNITVNRASLNMYSTGGMTGEGRLELWGVDGGGQPDPGNIITTSNDIDLTGLGASAAASAFEEATFSSPPVLTGGTQYALVFNAYNGTGGYTVSAASSDVFAGGVPYWDSDGGASWSVGSNDFTFKVIEDATSATFDLTWDADAYVQQEGFDKTRNTLQATTISDISNEEGILYVTVNKTTDAVTNLTVNKAEIGSYAPGDDDLIIARVVDSGVEVGKKLFLTNGESSALENGIAPAPVIPVVDTPINYISNPGAEDGTSTGWSGYNDGLVSAPVDGTGGTATNHVFVVQTDAQLRDSNYFRFDKSNGNNPLGEGRSYDFAIDKADTESVLQVSFDHNNTVNYVSGYLKVYVYDVDNTTLIGALSNADDGDIISHTDPSKQFAAQFSTTDSLNYRLIFHYTNSDTIGYFVSIDNLKIKPVEVVSEYREVIIESRPQTASADTWVASTETITLIPGTWDLGYNVCLRVTNTAGTNSVYSALRLYDNSNAAVVPDSYSNQFLVESSTGTDMRSHSQRVQVIVTENTDFNIQIASSVASAAAVSIIEDSNITGGITGTHNTSKIWARKVK